MRLIVDSVIRPIAALALATVVANCTEGCVGWYDISPADAYAMEVSGCVAKANKADSECVSNANFAKEAMECRGRVEEEHRKCRAMVDRKYGMYNGSGGYPAQNP